MKKQYFFLVFLVMLMPRAASAQICENLGSAAGAVSTIGANDMNNFLKYTQQQLNFIQKKIVETGIDETKARLEEFDANVRRAWAAWYDRLIPAFKDATKQLSASSIQQTLEIGALMDAQLLVEAAKNNRERLSDARRRYAPSELTCQADSSGPGETKAYQMSRALARAFARQDSPRIMNAEGASSATGMLAELNVLWNEYVAKFCDPTRGDQGCTQPGTMAGKHRDIPALLWGDRQTIDMTNPDNRLITEASLRYLIRPVSEDPILSGAAKTSSGHQAILERRAEAARINTVYNVLGQMMGERAGGSGVNAQALRIAAGLPAADGSVDASYREIQQTMTKDRFYDPAYVTRMIGNIGQTGREQINLNARRLQILNDLYKRSEEMLFMEAAGYSRDLDKEMPSSAISASPLNR